MKRIDNLHARLGKAEKFFDYVRALQEIGVEKYESYVTDGHSEYFGHHGHKVVSKPVHEALLIAEESDKESFLKHLALHEQGKITYLEMSRGLAQSGVEKWSVNTGNETMIYYDIAGNGLLLEKFD